MEQQETDIPAILGGKPAVTLPQDEANRWPILTEEDERAVVEVMRSGNITTHPIARGTWGTQDGIIFVFGCGTADEAAAPRARRAVTWRAACEAPHHERVTKRDEAHSRAPPALPRGTKRGTQHSLHKHTSG